MNGAGKVNTHHTAEMILENGCTDN